MFTYSLKKILYAPISRTLLSATTLSQRGPGSNSNEGVLNIPRSSRTRATQLDCFMSYPRHLLRGEALPLCRDAVNVFYSPSWLGCTDIGVDMCEYRCICMRARVCVYTCISEIFLWISIQRNYLYSHYLVVFKDWFFSLLKEWVVGGSIYNVNVKRIPDFPIHIFSFPLSLQRRKISNNQNQMRRKNNNIQALC